VDGLIERRTEPKEEIATEVVKHNRVWGRDPREGRATEAQEVVRAREFAKAQAHLKKLTYVQVMDLLQAMPVGVLELYLLVEECDQNRDEILRYFPKPGVRARERWLPETLARVDA